VYVLTAHPIQQFKKNPRFYLHYDAFYFVVCAAIAAGMALGPFGPLVVGFHWGLVVSFPVVLYLLIVAHLVIHNATHGNLPRAINRIVGEILGLIVVVRFASWDIVHMRHHRFSDDRERDPHPNFKSFWKTVHHTIVNTEVQLQQQYFDVWGDTPENRRYERFRARVSYGTNVVVLLAWYFLLGPWAFFCVFAPANLLAALFVIHFNWSTHNGAVASTSSEFRPVNLNSGYYRIGNLLFSGIYFHANHHKRPHLFNPARWNEAKLGPAERPVDADAPVTA
jgi:stearoyl-CoA desaturase (delta-9 desaturase)